MAKAIITRGYSGSGKTTFARSLGIKMVSRDDLRTTLFGAVGKVVLSSEQETEVTRVQRQIIMDTLDSGQDIVIHDTNLNPKFLNQLCSWINLNGHDFEIENLFVTEDVCIERNVLRADHDRVPESVIRAQSQKYPFVKWAEPENKPFHPKPYVRPHIDEEVPFAFGFDLDGTLAHMDGRDPYDTHLYDTDIVDIPLRALTLMVHCSGGTVIIFTGRSEDHREVVEEWLADNDVPYDKLIMRKSGDMRNDAIVKSELFDEFVAPHYDFLGQFDDRDRVVKMLRRKGIKVFQVAEGDF